MLRRFLRMHKALLGVAIVVVVVLTGVAAPVLAPADYTETDLGSVWAAPSGEHLLGADKLGRDILSRLMFGARVSLVVTVAVLSVTFAIGVSAGMVAGYFGGWIDAVVMRVADIVLAFPELIFAIFVAAVLGAGIVSVIVALSLAWWPGVARLTRSLVLSLRSEAFLEAAVACGTPTGKILWRHVLPNIAPALIVRASIGVGFIVMAEATLSFLGIGVQEPTPSWGGMIRDGLEGLQTDPYLALFSSAALGVTILGFNLLGDGLRDLLDPRGGGTVKEMWIERTSYYAKPGLADAVLEARRRASAVRAAIGLPVGAIFVRADGDGPEVRWECAFPSAEAHAADLAARAGSPEFEAVRAQMRSLIDRFERHLERRDGVSPLPSGMVDRALHGHAMLPREIAFRSGNHLLKGYLFVPPCAGPFPCMVLNHGSGIERGTLDVSRPGTASLLAGWGIASFLPHRHGYGNSEGPPWRKEVSSAFGTAEYDAQLAARLDRESNDVLAAAELVAGLDEIRADHIGVMGSSFGGVNTLLAAAKSKTFRCAVEFAGAAMNWDRTPGLRRLMTDAALRLTIPIFFIQAENDYSIRPTRELAQALEGSSVVSQAKVFPPFGITPHEGHLFERDGARLWAPEVRRFLERYL